MYRWKGRRKDDGRDDEKMLLWKRESTKKRARCEDDERLAKLMSKEIGEDGIVERKVVAERRSGRACSYPPLEGVDMKSESTEKERDAKTMNERRK